MRGLVMIVVASVAVSGCAMSAKGLGKGDVEKTWQSAKPAQQVAGCLAAALFGSNPVFQDENGHWLIIRKNAYGAPITRYDVFEKDGQTVIELRSTFGFMRGSDKLERCL